MIHPDISKRIQINQEVDKDQMKFLMSSLTSSGKNCAPSPGPQLSKKLKYF